MIFFFNPAAARKEKFPWKKVSAIFLLVSSLGPPAAANARTQLATEPRTAAAVRAADDGWSDAELRGDEGFVDRLLLPHYRSIGPTGKATEKAAIVARAKARHPRPSAAGAQVAAWKATHPTRSAVALYGDTAVLTWVSTLPRTEGRVLSCGIFIYRERRWWAAYSQHAELG